MAIVIYSNNSVSFNRENNIIMKRRNFINSSLAGMSLLMLNKFQKVQAGTILQQETAFESVFPVDNKKAMINPDMGWTLHFYSNNVTNYGSKLELSDTLDDFPGLSTVYLRVPWSYIELEEGKFNWELLDTPGQKWINKGKKVAFRITAEESSIRYATPEWVLKAGAKGYYWGKDNSLWEPDFNDPVFLEKAENFLSAMAKRYDGNPNVAFIDIGHFGLWGEGHTVHSTHINYGFDVLKKHIDIYCRQFKQTLLCISDDFVGHDKPGYHFPLSDYAFSKGVTLRDDSILVQNFGLPMPSWEQTAKPMPWYHAEMAQYFWSTLPVILEHEHYGSSVKRNAWDKDMFLKSVEDYHASYMSIHWWPREFMDANRDVIDKINLRMGYRIQLKSITWPKQVQLGKPFQINAFWANAGVAPCYPGGFPCFTIKDTKGGIVSVLTNESFNIKNLQVAEPEKAPSSKQTSVFTIASNFKDPNRDSSRNALAGDYDLFVSVGMRDGTPVLELPYEDNDGFKRYKLGKIKVLNR